MLNYLYFFEDAMPVSFDQYGPFCHGALKHDISTLFTTFFV